MPSNNEPDMFSVTQSKRRGRQPAKGMNDLYDEHGQPVEDDSPIMSYEELFAETFTRTTDAHHHREKLSVSVPGWLASKVHGIVQNDPRYKVGGLPSLGAFYRDAIYKLVYVMDRHQGNVLAKELRRAMDIDSWDAETISRREDYEKVVKKIDRFEEEVNYYLDKRELENASAEMVAIERTLPEIGKISEIQEARAYKLMAKIDKEAHKRFGEFWEDARGTIEERDKGR